MYRLRFIVVFLIVSLSIGCAGRQSADYNGVQDITKTASTGITPTQLIAMNFVNALQQIESLQPGETTVNLLRASSTDGFTKDMKRALQAEGYAIRWVNDASSGRLFQYRQEQDTTAPGGQLVTYEIAVGSVELRRSYLSNKEAGIRLMTPLYVRGVDGSGIVMNDAVFMDDNRLAAVQPESTASSLSVPEIVNPLLSQVPDANRLPGSMLPLIDLTQAENVFVRGQSNFEDLLATHHMVSKMTLLFPNDSLRLGQSNKRLVEQMVNSFQPGSDLFSVVGCSLGPTRIEDGNAALALGRASRVREALKFAGIPADRILAEGCWAGDNAASTLPRRGVVVTLNRQI